MPEHDSMKSLLITILAAVIFIPDIIMFYALRNIIYEETIFYLVIIFVLEILFSKFVKVYGSMLILSTILVMLVLYLKTLLSYTHVARVYFYYLPDIYITDKLMFTAIVIIIFSAFIGGLFTKKFWELISSYIVVSGFMLMQMATLAFMLKGGITINGASFISNLGRVSTLEYISVLSLFTHGYQIYLPLYKLSLPLAYPLAIGFMISVIGTIFWLYSIKSSKIDNVFGYFSIIPGLLIGYIFFEMLHYFTPVKFEFLLIAVVIAFVYVLISYSNRKSQDISVKADINNGR